LALRPASDGGTAPSDFGALTSSHLFGEVAAQRSPVAEAVIDAPETTLTLVLTGTTSLVGMEHDPLSSAIIASNRGEDRRYPVGQTIQDADGATVHAVYSDRVLLNRNGHIETLRLPELAASSSRMAIPSPVSQGVQPLRDAISENAARLTDVVRLAAHVQEGQLIGFRVTPGRDRAAFEALGLKPGDVVTDINGTVLDDPSRGFQIFQALGESAQANVTVLRDGVPQVIVIDTSQLRRLGDNLE
jgi:general secretion pathway protein C